MQKDRFGKHISLIYRHSQIFFNVQFKSYNLGSGQYIFLVNLYQNQGITQEQLSDIVKMDKATTAKAIAKLIAEGYVIRKTCESDRRAYNLYTTEKAEAIKGNVFEILDEWNDIMMSTLDTKDRKRLFKLIEKISTNIVNYQSK